MLSTLLSSFLPTAYAEEENPPKEEGGAAAEEAEAKEEEEEDEPEDPAPALREECAESAACSGFNKHFQHCTEKVTNGEGYKGEDCVEELCKYDPDLRWDLHSCDLSIHLDLRTDSPNCIAPKLFSKLR